MPRFGCGKSFPRQSHQVYEIRPIALYVPESRSTAPTQDEQKSTDDGSSLDSWCIDRARHQAVGALLAIYANMRPGRKKHARMPSARLKDGRERPAERCPRLGIWWGANAALDGVRKQSRTTNCRRTRKFQTWRMRKVRGERLDGSMIVTMCGGVFICCIPTCPPQQIAGWLAHRLRPDVAQIGPRFPGRRSGCEQSITRAKSRMPKPTAVRGARAGRRWAERVAAVAR